MKKIACRMHYIVLFCIALLLISAVIASLFLKESSTRVDLLQALQAPNATHWFGTDALGRSVFARTLSGTLETLIPAGICLLLSVLIGSLIGMISGFIGGKVDRFIYLLITAFQAFPSIILVVAIVGILGIGLQQTVIAICLTAWTKYAYMVRALTLQLKVETYIQAAPMYGNRTHQILIHYYLPSIISQLLTTMSFDVSTIIMEISGLSFIGLGAQVPSAEWGAMISDGRIYIQQAPWIVLFPCLMIVLSVTLFTQLGEHLNRQQLKTAV